MTTADGYAEEAALISLTQRFAMVAARYRKSLSYNVFKRHTGAI